MTRGGFTDDPVLTSILTRASAAREGGKRLTRLVEILEEACARLETDGHRPQLSLNSKGTLTLRLDLGPVGRVVAVAGSWTAQDDARLLDLRGQRLSRAAIAARMGVSTSAVSRRIDRLRKAGIDVPAAARGPLNPRRFWTPERDRLLLRLSASPMSTQAIADEIGTTRPGVEGRLTKLRRAGVPLPDRRATAGQRPEVKAQRRSWTPDRDRAILDASSAGRSMAEIAAAMPWPVTADAVAIRLSKLRRGLAEATRPLSPAEQAARSLAQARRARRQAAAQQMSDFCAPPCEEWIEGWMPPAEKARILADHLRAVGAGAADLAICEAAFAGRKLAEDQAARFRALTAPFRGLGCTGLPVETAGFVLPALRDLAGEGQTGEGQAGEGQAGDARGAAA